MYYINSVPFTEEDIERYREFLEYQMEEQLKAQQEFINSDAPIELVWIE